ncbi:hypothetical protein [Streptomyces sp. RB13]|uniref:hypothetical protein n=1 Tax=Streptomyces sp. RB13 TaxID=2950978 RepID=UPI002FC72132
MALPPPSTFNQLARVLADPLEHPGRPARTATAPVRPFTPTVALGRASWCRSTPPASM